MLQVALYGAHQAVLGDGRGSDGLMFRDDQRFCPKSAFPGEQSKTGTSMHILGDAQWCGNGQREEL